jgi:hypothetical protein
LAKLLRTIVNGCVHLHVAVAVKVHDHDYDYDYGGDDPDRG